MKTPPLTKTQNGVTYRRVQRPAPYSNEYIFYWRGHDGSVLEFTNDEMALQDTSRALSDEVGGE